jgi:hypothetical protein
LEGLYPEARDETEGVDTEVLAMLRSSRVQARLRGEPHRHHSECIHNLSVDEQLELRGDTPEKLEALGFPMPVQITPDDWEVDVGYKCLDCGWEWPMATDPPASAECDHCGGELGVTAGRFYFPDGTEYVIGKHGPAPPPKGRGPEQWA